MKHRIQNKKNQLYYRSNNLCHWNYRNGKG